MTLVLTKRRQALTTVVAIAIIGAAAFGLWLDPSAPTASAIARHVPDHPDLFANSPVCPHSTDRLEAAARLEEQARLRADRYLYDARDGVLAVARYREADACYRAAGHQGAADRAREMTMMLSTRVDADYAAARLNLVNALGQERWKAALSIIQRLLLLTEDLGRNAYVDWLNEIEGRVAAKASTAS